LSDISSQLNTLVPSQDSPAGLTDGLEKELEIVELKPVWRWILTELASLLNTLVPSQDTPIGIVDGLEKELEIVELKPVCK